MKINELEFQDANGNEINPTKKQMSVFIAYLNKENNRLKTELAELKQNAIVLKFKVGDEVWFLYDENDDNNFTIMHKKVMAFACCTHFEYAMSDDGTQDTRWYGYINEKFIFATLAEAEEALKVLEE